MATPAHQHNELAAKLIRELRGHGLPIKSIARHLEWLQEQEICDLGGQGYSLDTLKRHYRLSLDVGALPTKHMLMQILAQGALGENIPDGVSPDVAYREGLANARWWLQNIEGIGAAKAPTEGKGQIPIDLVREVLTVDELHQLERIMGKLHRAMDPSRAIIDANAAEL